jgi:hypothetical protein
MGITKSWNHMTHGFSKEVHKAEHTAKKVVNTAYHDSKAVANFAAKETKTLTGAVTDLSHGISKALPEIALAAGAVALLIYSSK